MKKIIKQENTTKIIISMILISIALILSVGSVSAADNDTIYVNDTGGNDDNNGTSWEWAKKSIKNATGTVNINGTVNIADGLYTGTGNTNILIDKNMTIQGQSKTGTIINGTDSARIFNITSGVNVTILNLTITNGRAPDGVFPDSFSGGNGGAIYNDGTLQIIGCILSNNRAGNGASFIVGGSGGNGGAIYNSGTLQIKDSTLSGNYAGDGGSGLGGGSAGSGGAIYNTGTLQISNCTLSGNNAGIGGVGVFGSGSGGSGGAICNYGHSTITNSNFTSNGAPAFGGAIENCGTSSITDCTFTSNTAGWGGAIHNYNGDLTVTNSVFSYNSAVSAGGAIHTHHDSAPATSLVITGCTFTSNTAGASGGAISQTVTPIIITGSTFKNNEAVNGGAIFMQNSVTITGSTFTDNSASNFGGAIQGDGSLTMTNSTFTGNNAGWDGGAIYSYYGIINITGSKFTGNTAHGLGGAIVSCENLNVSDSTFTDNSAAGYTTGTTYGWGGAIFIQRGVAQIHFNRIAGNNAVVGDAIYFDNSIGGSVNAENNWWGSNNPDFPNLISGTVDHNPWLYMTIAANPTTINNTETSIITVSFNNLFDGTTVTPLNPATGHIPDGTPVTFNTDKGSIGCKTIEKQTSGGVATAILTADELAGIAHINATTDNQTLFVNVTITPKSSLYLTVTPSKANPVVGDTVMYTLKVGNKGPDTAKDVIMTYVVPEGLEFVGAKVDVGEWKYDPATRTITWNISDVPVGDPYMWLSLSIAHAGQYLINPTLITSTYDPTLNSDTQSLTVNAATQVNAASKTIPLQKTGMPLAGLIMAILAVFSGLVMSKRK